MFGITATHTIKPACIDRYHQLMAELAEHSRKEPGCADYRSLQSDDDPRVHLLIEIWHDKAALEAHCNTTHFQSIVPLLPDLYEAPETATWYQVIA